MSKTALLTHEGQLLRRIIVFCGVFLPVFPFGVRHDSLQ